MPIKAITGATGDGKTSFLVSQLLKLEKEKSKRHIIIVGRYDPDYDPESKEDIQDGIIFLKQLKLDIEYIEYSDLMHWETFEYGSLIIIDEAQKILKQRTRGDAPAYITSMSTHRHLGLDFIFLTQDPRLLDAWARRLVKHHTHIKRLFGTTFQVAFVWSDKMVDDPRDTKEQRTATKSLTRINKDSYGVYWSAKTHTIKRSIPTKIITSLLTFILVPLVGYYAFTSINMFDSPEEKKQNTESTSLTKLIAPSLTSQPVQKIEKSDKLIDQELIYYGYLKLNHKNGIEDVYLELITDHGKTKINIHDLRSEPDLTFSIPTRSKIILNQSGVTRTIYRTAYQTKPQRTITDPININPFTN